nr:MAG TPA: Chromosome region maintenance protein [Caudoviricetes sp.]
MHRFLLYCKAQLYGFKIHCLEYWYLSIVPFICRKSILQMDLSKLDNEIFRFLTFIYLNNMISHEKYIEYCKELDDLKSLKVDL